MITIITVFTLNIGTPPHTIHVIKCEQIHLLSVDVLSFTRMANSIDPDQTPRYAASDQGLHCLFRHLRIFPVY